MASPTRASARQEYASLPRLVGRAVVELTFEKRDGSLGFLDPVAGGPAKRATLRLTLDGYSAPLSAGAFLRNVKEGLYDGRWAWVERESGRARGREGEREGWRGRAGSQGQARAGEMTGGLGCVWG